MTISNWIAQNALKYPESPALILGEHVTTYAAYNDEINRLAAGLQALGVKVGDRVAIFMPNTPEFASALPAIHRIGAVAVPLNARLTTSELNDILTHAEAKAILAHEALMATAKDIAMPDGFIKITTAATDQNWHAFQSLIDQAPPVPELPDINDDDLATLLYTSGTTGQPKGVRFTHRSIQAVSTMMAVETEMKPSSRMLHMMPLSHSAPLHLFFAAGMMTGASHVFHPTFTPDALLEQVKLHRPTHFFGAPVAYLMTAGHPALKDTDLSSVNWWVYGGAPLGTKEVEWVRSQFNTDRFLGVYGLTEAGPSGTLLTPEEHGEKSGSIGARGALGAAVALLNEDGDHVSPGDVGEIAL
ncbi:feruloyl-CoA synthase [Salsuginibacillus halophilus]|uniref:Feruloyl-CoA synthase n=1 Tax=Salsuginibacillus halophilus TaxID=517424 RepID=A0A2P8HW66_9BACI|nr:feruloyl-CoA synthase [Salsuginibacillus halophilus]